MAAATVEAHRNHFCRLLRLLYTSDGQLQRQFLSLQTQQNVKATDSFVFHVDIYRCLHDGEVIRIRLFQTPIYITCKDFFVSNNTNNRSDNNDFLRRNLGRYLVEDQLLIPNTVLDYVTREIMPELQRLFVFQMNPFDFQRFPRRKAEKFEFNLEIVFDVDGDGDGDGDGGFESAPVRMIPASNEAINESLRTYRLPRSCAICMEKFYGGEGGDDDNNNEDEEVEISVMPCDHVFHRRCILQWLNTSHMCPVCRYRLPTTSN